ncbi:MAG: hypothetical protein HZC54_05495 [Verrucomicrobia bacterium]|nr:hypothetical protein [Verrucomicrobiota bacterium]
MNRREFLLTTSLATGGLLAGSCGSPGSKPAARVAAPSPKPAKRGAERFRWTRNNTSRLFTDVACEGRSWVGTELVRIMDGTCRLLDETQVTLLNASRYHASHGPLRLELRHQLHDSGNGVRDDLLEATLTVRNASDRPQQVEVGFGTSVQPAGSTGAQQVYVPLNAAGLFGDGRFAALGVKNFLKDCNQPIGTGEFVCHYLEPMASHPAERETRALLLAPVVDVFSPQLSWRTALFTPSDEPMRFSAVTRKPLFGSSGGAEKGSHTTWRANRCVTVAAGSTLTQRCWLLLHQGNASVAWQSFHRFAHREEFAVPGWAREMKVHYYDFLSSAQGEKDRRGDGYETDLPCFREFRVGMATQHGYYPTLGDYIRPDRKTWQAMRGDKQGAAEMSFDKIRDRIKATRAAGAKAAVYLHPVLFDDATPFFQKMRDSVLVDAAGKLVPFPWKGPDTVGNNWRASLASPQWREHLLQQAQWIMDLLKPDAIVMDETFAGLGYDHHPNHAGPTSAAAIEFYRKLRALVRSFGADKAFFTSDCSMSPFVLWADGECGDHAYPGLLGHALYTQEPVRYLAALGDKPWRPCAWHFRQMWPAQMKLARQVGAGVGVSNGWLEYTGLTRLPADAKARILGDIQTLFNPLS